MFDALPSDIRHGLQQTLQGFGQALDTRPTAADNAHLDPAVRGLTGGEAINKTFNTSVAVAARLGDRVRGAHGPSGRSLSRVVSGLAHASQGLGRRRRPADVVHLGLRHHASGDRRRTAGSAPDRQPARTHGPQRQRRLRGARRGVSGHRAVRRTTSPPACRSSRRRSTAAYPWLAQAGPLLSHVRAPRSVATICSRPRGDLAQLTHSELQFLPQIDAFDRCMNGVFLPTGNIVVNDGPLSSGTSRTTASSGTR